MSLESPSRVAPGVAAARNAGRGATEPHREARAGDHPQPRARTARRWVLASLVVHAVLLGVAWFLARESEAPTPPGRGDFAATAFVVPADEIFSDLGESDKPPDEAPVLLALAPAPPEPPLPEPHASAELPPPEDVRALPEAPPTLPFAPGARHVRPARPARIRLEPAPVAAPAPPTPRRQAPAPPSGAVVGARELGTNRPPAYPAEARARGIGGVVLLLIEVDPAGRVAAVSVARSSGHPLLDEAARTAALAWRFAPARRGGVPVTARLHQRVRFDLAAGR